MPASITEGPIRVVTFNIKLSRAIDRAIRVLETPSLRDADLIALQEMDDAGTRRIAEALGMNYVYFPAAIHPTDHRYFGPAVLSRWPIVSDRKLLLPHAGSVRRQRRTATVATVLVRGTPIRVYAVHLEPQARLSPNQYREQAATILADAASSPDPVVIAGDFNGREIGGYLEAKGYRWPTERVGKTSFLFSLDHIFVRGLTPVDSATAGVVADVQGASDHHPVWARVVLPVGTMVGGSHP
jgi:endonuclease/exonuclease/phosphatase family metal-dependent hydrolase